MAAGVEGQNQRVTERWGTQGRNFQGEGDGDCYTEPDIPTVKCGRGLNSLVLSSLVLFAVAELFVPVATLPMGPKSRTNAAIVANELQDVSFRVLEEESFRSKERELFCCMRET